MEEKGWVATNIFITDSELGSVIANKINIEREFTLSLLISYSLASSACFNNSTVSCKNNKINQKLLNKLKGLI